MKWRALFALMALAGSASAADGPAHVDITWMSVTNMYYEIGPVRVVTDGYITRLPQDTFFGGGGGLARSRQAYKPDVAAVKRVRDALGGAKAVNLLLTGHSHFDHSFDTAAWSSLTGARIVGSPTTCFQAIAQKIPANRCTPVLGGESLALGAGVRMRVVRFNHSGDPAQNPEQHDPFELEAPPLPDPVTGGLRPGVAEDFPNGGGNRGYLFVVESRGGRYSWFFNNSASAVDLAVPIVVAGKSYGAPLENLKQALRAEQLESVDLWIGGGGAAVAELLLPVLKPKAFLPVHFDGFWKPLEAGLEKQFASPELEALVARSGATLVRPAQYMDKWRLDAKGVTALPNPAVKKALRIPDPPR